MAFSFWDYHFSFFEIFTFLYYANEESDDVISGSTKTVEHSIKNSSRNIGAVFFKLGTRNVHHKRNRITPTMLLPWQHSWLQSLSVKNQISPFAIFLTETEGLARHANGSHIAWTIPIRLLCVDGDRWQSDRCHFASFVMYSPDTKFEKHWFNISRDILDWVLYCFSETSYDVIAFLTKT